MITSKKSIKTIYVYAYSIAIHEYIITDLHKTICGWELHEKINIISVII